MSLNTRVYIDAEDFLLLCPHCNTPVEEVQIHGTFTPDLTCDACFNEFPLVITTDL